MNEENQNAGFVETEKDFEEFHWKDQLRYRCNRTWESGALCQFDTYDMLAMMDHLKSPHNRSGKFPKQKPTSSVMSSLVDGNGKPIVFAEEPAQEFKDVQFKESE